MSKDSEIEKLVSKIEAAYKGGTFKNFIEYIRFPFYKNLQIDSKIEFNFPLTVLVGQNGSGKSSALHAIYGMPEGYSTGIFWFATQVDPIEDDAKNRPGYVYGYNYNSEVVEVVKTRIGKSKGSHYWEPSRPLLKWGMKKMEESKRNPTIIKEVYYLDFRAELSAYDKYFYFTNFRATKTIKSKQDVVIKRSKHLKATIDSNAGRTHFKRKIHAPKILSESELLAVNNILGKNYVECKLVSHNLYSDMEGLTIYFKTSQIAYSEAFAGRGEFAVVKLVHEIMSKPDYSLIILDEPEVSLHPGAQEKLLEFILKQTLEKKLQVVLSTHSPTFVHSLPENALKLFYPTEGARFGIKNQCHYAEAFQNLGQELGSSDKKVIYAEDYLVKLILDKIIQDLNNELISIFDIKCLPGGAEDLLKRAAGFSQENEMKKFILLDGDKEKPKIDISKLTVKESETLSDLEQKIKEITGLNFKSLQPSIDSDGDLGGSKAQKIEFALKYVSYIYSNLEYLPTTKTPEDMIWDAKYANEFLKLSGKPEEEFNKSSKENIKRFAAIFFGAHSKDTYQSSLKLLIERFVQAKGDDYNSLLAILNKFKTTSSE
jgi:predicted ATPase